MWELCLREFIALSVRIINVSKCKQLHTRCDKADSNSQTLFAFGMFFFNLLRDDIYQ